jgi:hypothetical protein
MFSAYAAIRPSRYTGCFRAGEFSFHPSDIQIDLKTTLMPESVTMDAFDVVIRIDRNSEPEEEQGYVSERLLDVESFPVCAPRTTEKAALGHARGPEESCPDPRRAPAS